MFSVILKKARETKRTVRYENMDMSDNCPITVLYIMKHALPTPYPESITIQVSDTP